MIGVEILLIFLVVSFTTYYAMNYWKTQRFRELVEKLPGHDGLSIWKSLYLLFTTKRKDYVPTFLSYVMDEYPMTKAWWLNQFLILTKDADFIHKVFNCNKTYNKPQKYYQGFVVKNSLLVMSGPDHKRHRKILNKAFTSNMLERLPEIFDEKSKKILDMMEERVDCGEFELTEYLGAYSFEAFGKSNFNYEMDYYKSDIYYAYESFCSLTVNIIPFLLAGISRKILNLTKLGKDLLKVEDTFHKFYDKVCKKNQNPADRIENSLVDLLLDPNNEFDEKEIKSELIMTMFGSFETTTRTVSIALMMLGMHKNVKDKAMKEINYIYSQEVDTEFTVEFLQKFTYLDLILKETMRLYAVAPIVSRETSDEVNINGYLIPKNTPILIMMYNMQRDKKYWGDDAEKFRPERFEEELINPHAYTPFTDGNRICIGYRYSLISMKIFLINFLRRYDVSCATKLEDIETEMTFTLNFVNGYKVGISKK